MKWLAMGLTALLISCASLSELTPEVRQEVQIATACSSFASFVDILKPRVNRISNKDLRALQILNNKVVATCNSAASGVYTQSRQATLALVVDGVEIVTLLACHYSPNSEVCM